MGLDMYLRGDKFLWGEARSKEDGYEVTGRTLELGYWRKHPDLHGYIVQRFAGGVDECQRINLDEAMLRQIRDAAAKRDLPHTEGFFFGTSRDEDYVRTLDILDRALAWLAKPGEQEIREVYYKASW